MAAGLIAVILFITVVIFTIIKLVPKAEDSDKSYVVIPFESFTRKLEMTVKRCVWDEIFRDTGERREILLVAMGEAPLEKARAFAEDIKNVRVLVIGELEKYIAAERSGEEVEGAGKDKGRGR